MAKIGEITVAVHADTDDLDKKVKILKQEIWWLKNGKKVVGFFIGYVIVDLLLDVSGFIFGW